MPQLDLQTLATRIAAKNPNLPPQAMIAALKRAEPLLTSQARIDLAKISAQMRQDEIGLRRQNFQETQRHHRALESYQQAGGAQGAVLRQLTPGGQQGSDAGTSGATEFSSQRRVDGPPPPEPIANMSSSAIGLQAEQFLQTGKITGFSARDPISRAQLTAIKNYAADLAEWRGMKPNDVVEMWRFAPRQAGWIMGADGRAAGSLGTVVDHLDTARQLFAALQNNDVQLFNRIKNTFAAQFGQPAPTNLQAASQIIGTEVMKAVGAQGAGSADERENAARHIGDLGKSPAQAIGAIDSLQKLIAGQLRTKQRQAEAIGLPKQRFDALVGKRALEVLGSIEPAAEKGGGGTAAGGGGPVKVNTPQDAEKLEPGTHYVTPDGREMVR